MTDRNEKNEHKKPGRPRKNGKVSDNQRKEILDAAILLFQEKGYANVSMVSIAQASGLSQSSLYYWFKSKRDIVRALAEANSASLRKAYEACGTEENIALCLYKVLFADTKNLCDLSFDFFLVENVAFSQQDSFGEFFKSYQELFNFIENLIVQGKERGVFVVDDPKSAAALALATNEGIQHRYHANGIPGAGMETDGLLIDLDSRQCAHEAARRTLSMLLSPSDFNNLIKEISETEQEQL